jgi:hypothetical protein
MSVEHEEAAPSGLSRRQLLTRGAIAGGLVWAAPVIRSTAAYATTANGTEIPCSNFFMVVITPDGQVHQAPANHDEHSLPPAIRQWFSDNPDVVVQFPQVPPLLTQNDGQLWAVLLPEVTGPNAAGRQCRMVLGWGRKGNSFAEGYVDPNPQLAIEVGRRLLFPCPDHPSGDHDDDNGGCKDGHDDGDHDADDVACDPSAVATAEGTTGTGTADSLTATGATSTPTAVGSQIATDGSTTTNPISGDGKPSSPISSDGHPSGDGPGPGKCIDAIYLIYCCPQ